MDRQGRLRGGRGVERHLLRHGLRRQRALHPPRGGRRPRRGSSADHPHRHLQHAHPRHRLSWQPASTRPAPDDRVPDGLRRRGCRRSPDAGAGLRATDRSGPLLAGGRPAPHRPSLRDRDRDGGPDLQPVGHGAADRAALPRGSHGRQLGRQGARRHRHAVDRRGGPRARDRLDRKRRQCRRLLGRGALLPSAAHRTPGRGRGAPAAHRHLEHAHQRARALR